MTPRSLLLAWSTLLLLVASNCYCASGWSNTFSRRKWFRHLGYVAATVTTSIGPCRAAESSSPNELPLILRDFTKLAPLGRRSSSSLTGKELNVSLEDLSSRLAVDLSSGHTGQGGYFISGDLDESIFRDDCVFVDPTNRVSSLTQYRNALRILFDPSESQVQLVKPMSVNHEENTIEATIRSRGVLQLPWRPYITAYESRIIYSVDENGLILEQSQTWSKSASRALQETFTPGLFRPAPQFTFPPGPK